MTGATLKAGSTWQFQWQLVAGDGSGDVTVKFDPDYGTNFQQGSVATIVSGPDSSIDVLGYYTLQVTIPAGLKCTGGLTGNMCSVQFQSTSAWYSCTSITTDISPAANNNVTQTGVPPCMSPGAQQNIMFFCANNNLGQYALRSQFGIWNGAGSNNNPIPTLQNPLTGFILQDQLANATFFFNMHSALVFSNSKNADGTLKQSCADAYTRYLCAVMFPACSSTQQGWVQPCKSTCYTAIEKCGLQSSHQNLINCVDNPNYSNGNYRAYDSENGQCPPCTGDCLLTVRAAASHTGVSMFAVVVSAVAALLFM